MGSDPVHHSQKRGHPALDVLAPCLYSGQTSAIRLAILVPAELSLASSVLISSTVRKGCLCNSVIQEVTAAGPPCLPTPGLIHNPSRTGRGVVGGADDTYGGGVQKVKMWFARHTRKYRDYCVRCEYWKESVVFLLVNCRDL